jgi:CarD family transcriptional regulator
LANDFKVGDEAICPAHFAGVIEGIETKVVSGLKLRFYIVRILQNNAKIMIPTDNLGPAQLRRPISLQEVEQIYRILEAPNSLPADGSVERWSVRQRRYKSVLATGSLLEIAGLLKALHRRKDTKGLAFGETQIMETAMDCLVGEVMCAARMQAEAARREIELRLETA